MSCCYFICCAIDPCLFVRLYIYTAHAHKSVLGQGFAPSYLACIFIPHTNIFFFLSSFFPRPYLFFTVSPFLTTFKGSLLLWLNGVLNDSNDHVTWMHFKDVTAGTVPHYKCLRAGKFCSLLCTEIVRCEVVFFYVILCGTKRAVAYSDQKAWEEPGRSSDLSSCTTLILVDDKEGKLRRREARARQVSSGSCVTHVCDFVQHGFMWEQDTT